MVEMFVYFVLKSIIGKLKLTLHNNVNNYVLRPLLSCTNIKNTIGSSYENLHHLKLPAIRYLNCHLTVLHNNNCA